MNKMGQSPSQYVGSSATTSPSSTTTAGNTSSASTTLTRHRTLLRSPFSRRRSKKRLELSAAFTVPSSANVESLNINTATVEQLMTLPGINRLRAETIVDHRNAIGGRFLKVDDLALVSGIGAEKLEIIRPEICVKRLPSSLNGSSVSSRTPSLDSILNESLVKETKNVNINTATIFQLQQIPGINQELAAKIIDYRNKKGKFHSLDHLGKVKGLSTPRLGAIKSYLSITDQDLDTVSTTKSKGWKPKVHRHSSSTFYTAAAGLSVASASATTPTSAAKAKLVNGQSLDTNDSANVKQINGVVPNGATSNHRKSLSVPIKMNLNLSNGFKSAPINDIYDLLSVYSQRPIIEDNLKLEKYNANTMRIGSWNLGKMSYAKSENLGIKEVFCRTILENKLTIVCLQEIMDPKALVNMCKELNYPKLKRVVEWRNNSHKWKFVCNKTCINDSSINGLGFLYDASIWELNETDIVDREIEMDVENSSQVSSSVVDGKKKMAKPTVLVANFKMNNWTCSIMNIYLKYYDLNNIDHVVDNLKKSFNLNDIYLVAGDFSGLLTRSSDFWNSNNINLLNNLGYFNLFPINSTLLLHDDGDESLNDNENDKKIVLNELNNNNTNSLSSCNIMCRENLGKLNGNNTNDDIKYVPNNNDNNNSNCINLNDRRLTNSCGIIRNGLHHMAIPKNWNWGGPISDYLPLWVEIYASCPTAVTPKITTPNLNCNGKLSIFNSNYKPPNDALPKTKLHYTNSSQSLTSLSNNNCNSMNSKVLANAKDNTLTCPENEPAIDKTSKIISGHSVDIDYGGATESTDSVFLKN